MQKLGQLQSLRFFALHRYGVSRLYPFADDMASDLQHLSLLYLDRSIWDIYRSGLETVLSPWPVRRKLLRLKEDFGNSDAEWLLRHGDFPVCSLCFYCLALTHAPEGVLVNHVLLHLFQPFGYIMKPP
jgi:hypothetical protein